MRQALASWSTRSRSARLALVTLLCLAVVGAGAVIAPRLTRASGGPTISGFSPASGPLRTIVTINGSGLLFTSGVTIGGVNASFRIRSNAWLDVRVPDTAQTGAIVVTTTGGTATSATNFTVAPGLALNPVALPPLQRIQPIIPTPTAWSGGSVQAQGSGFAPGETIGFSLDGASIGQTTTADAHGLFTNVTLQVPYGIASGGHQASATGQASALTTQTALSILDIWRQFGHDAAHTSNNANEAAISATTFATLQRKWKSPPTDQSQNLFDAAQPAVENGSIFISTDATLYAYSTDTGARKWSRRVDGGSFGSTAHTTPTVVNGVLYLAGYGSVRAFDEQNGNTLWTAPFPIAGTCSECGYVDVYYLTYADGKIFAVGDNRQVSALNASTGAILWTWTSGLNHLSMGGPAVSGGAVYVSFADGLVASLNETTGAKNWSAQVATGDDRLGPSPVVDGGRVFVTRNVSVGRSIALHALDATTGSTLWTATDPLDTGFTDSQSHSVPVVANGFVYINPYGAKLAAFNVANGAQVWKGGIARNYGPNAILANGMLYDPRLDNTTGYFVLEAYNASTGALLSTYKELTGFLMSPVLVNGALFMPARDNTSGASWICSYTLPSGSVITGPGIVRPATR